MLVDLILFMIAICLSIPLLIVGSQCLIALFVALPDAQTKNTTGLTSSYKILIPAHNETKIIGKTLTNLVKQLPDANPQNIIVIADNCTDETGKIAKSFGVNVLERHNANERGKGFALDFGIQNLRLADHQPDILVILDADCETDKASLTKLLITVQQQGLPAQMVYLMRSRENTSIKQKIAGFAWLLKNKIRLLAMNALKLPVILTGTGMAFPWQVFAQVRLGHANLVEDMQLGIDCASHGFPPVLCANALVYSDFPEQAAAEQTQRTRWEHGHLQTIIQQVPGLIAASLKQKKIGLLVLALDIGVPPLTLLVMIALGGILALSFIAWWTTKTSALAWLTISFFYFALMLSAAWWKFGREYLAASDIGGIPVYIIEKLSIYSSFIFKRQKDWVRTERDN